MDEIKGNATRAPMEIMNLEFVDFFEKSCSKSILRGKLTDTLGRSDLHEY